MAEEIVYLTSPTGVPYRCVKSVLTKTPGNDPWGRPLNPQIAKMAGL